MPRGIHDKFVAVLFAWTCGFARIYSSYPHTMKVTLLQQGGPSNRVIESWPIVVCNVQVCIVVCSL